MNSEKKIVITKVIIKSDSKKKIIMEDESGTNHFEFLYDGRVWKWCTTSHIVDKPLSDRLDKAYKKWLRKTNKVSKGNGIE